jgi:hypothetical protein
MSLARAARPGNSVLYLRSAWLVEYDPDGKMVWSWDDPSVRPQGMETLIVLDNLDPAVLNDDRDGVLKPQH